MSTRLGFIVVLLLLVSAQAFSYTGTLAGSDITGSGVWADKYLLPADEQPSWIAPSLAWTISQNPDNTWLYDYTLTVYDKGISHFILEVSDEAGSEFTKANVLSSSWPMDKILVQAYDSAGSSSNPGMPSQVRGVKFDGATGTVLHIWFNSDRKPVWGDFFSKDGTSKDADHHNVWNAVWNTGFGNPDSDPTDPASDGTNAGHLLVPDTTGSEPPEPPNPPVPEPAGMVALGAGLMSLASLALRKRRL